MATLPAAHLRISRQRKLYDVAGVSSGCQDALKVIARPVAHATRRLAPLILLTLATGCAKHYTPEAVADPYGFFSGVWHGIVWPYALIANVLSWLAAQVGFSILSDIQLIGRPNTGFGYYIGFVIGLLSYFGAGSNR